MSGFAPSLSGFAPAPTSANGDALAQQLIGRVVGKRGGGHGVGEGKNPPGGIVGLAHIRRAVAPVTKGIPVAVVDGAGHRHPRARPVLRHVRVRIVGPCLIRTARVVHARAPGEGL